MTIKKYALLFISAWLLMSTTLMTHAKQPQDKANFLLIITDEHNFRTIGAYRDLTEKPQAHMWGDKVVETPNLDYLAKNGAIFTSMYAPSPSCTPARASIFTGQYPQTVGMPKNGHALASEIPTIADVLLADGYHTAYTGKLHLLGHGAPMWQPKENFGFTDNRYMFNAGHWKKLGFNPDGSGRVASVNKNGKPNSSLDNANEKSFTTDWLTDRALAVFDDSKKMGKPFFQVISYPDPHTPNTVRAPYDTMFNADEMQLPHTWHDVFDKSQPSWRQPEIDFAMKAMGKSGKKQKLDAPKLERSSIIKKLKTDIAQYFGMVRCIDDNIGRLLARLKANGQLDNTVILFTSDHGDLLGEHGRDNKGVPFEASAKVPFIIYYPKAIKANTVVNKAASLVDLMDTSLSLLNAKHFKPDLTTGRDLTPWFTNQAVNPQLQDLTFVSFKSWAGAFTDRYKLVVESTNTSPWLIDLAKDPDENTNFINDPNYKSIIKQLAAALKQYGKEQKDAIVLNKNIQEKLNKLAG